MMQHNIPLRREILKAPKYQRAKKAVKAIKEYVSKHTKVSFKNVKLGRHLNMYMWSQGIKNPPMFVKVNVDKQKELVMVELLDAPIEVEVKKPAKKTKTPVEKDAHDHKEHQHTHPEKVHNPSKTEEKDAHKEQHTEKPVKKENTHQEPKKLKDMF